MGDVIDDVAPIPVPVGSCEPVGKIHSGTEFTSAEADVCLTRTAGEVLQEPVSDTEIHLEVYILLEADLSRGSSPPSTRPQLQRKPPERLDDWEYPNSHDSYAVMAKVSQHAIPPDPQTYHEALQSLEAQH